MALFLPPLEIPEDAGFSSQFDIFGRSKIGKSLTNLVSEANVPLTIALDGQWGCGKSTFLKMWAGDLRENGFPVIYFDAFENDYVADPFLALAGEVLSLLNNARTPSKRSKKQFSRQAAGVGRILLRGGLRVGVKLATAGALNSADLEGLADLLPDEAADAASDIVEEILEKRENDKSTIASFRGALEDLPGLLSAGPDDPPKPLVFIIDELDRCRPDFALEFMERIKHFFSVKNVHFVFGVYMKQLETSVAARYGAGIDKNLYLQKFVSLTLSLEGGGEEYRHDAASSKYIGYLRNKIAFPEGHANNAAHCVEIIDRIAYKRDLTLRSMEKVFTYLGLALNYTPPGYLIPPPIIGGLCVLKVTHPELFLRAKRGSLSYAEIEAALGLGSSDDDSRSQWAERWWRFCLDPNLSEESVREMDTVKFQYNIGDRMKLVSYLSNDVIDRFSLRQS